MSRTIAGLAVTISLTLGFSAGAHAEGEMDFQAVSYHNETVISAIGRITERTPAQFIAFLREHASEGVRPVVFLDSPGGIVLASMELGTTFRKIGAAVVVGRVARGIFGSDGVTTNAECLSACVYALMGARKRVIPPSSEVGIHKMFLTVDGVDVTTTLSKKERAMAGTLRNLLSSYASRMGVNPQIIARAETTPSLELHMLSRAEIRKWNLGVPNL